MKKILVALPLFIFVACTTESKDTTSTDTHQTAEMPAKQIDYKTHDPICDMEIMDDWTEFSVYNNDTVKFCSPHCKETFDAEPTKYITAN